MQTVNVQERLVNRREPLRCPQLGIDLAETGPGQPVVLICNHFVSTKGIEQLLGREEEGRRCPVCKHPIPEGAKVSDFMMAPQILHEVRYPDKGFPADGPMPAPRGNGKMPTPLQALQSVDHSGLLDSKGEPKRLPVPIQQKRVIDDRPNAALPTNARFVRPYDYPRVEREELMQAAKADPESVPYEELKPGDLVVSKSPKELQQEATMGFERFQMDSIFPLGAITVALSALLPRPSAPATAPAEAVHVAAAPAAAASAAPAPVAPTAATAAAAAAGGAYTDGEIEQLLGKLNWDSELVSMDDIQNARTEAQEAYETLCRRTGRTHEQLQIDYLEAALERTLEIAGSDDGLKLVKALDRVRADGRSSRLFVVTGVDQKTYKAEVRRVRLGNLRRLQPLRNAWDMRQRRGGATKGAIGPVDQEMEKLGAESDHMKNLGKLLFGYNRDEGWVEALLSEDDDAAAREDLDSDSGALGWRIYDPEEGLSDEDDE